MSNVQPSQPLAGAARRRRCQRFTPAYRRAIRGQRYPADPPAVDEIVAVMRVAGQARYGARLNGLIVVLWRAGLRIHEALSLLESDLDPRRGSILVRHGKNDRRREVGMDSWGWSALEPWLAERAKLPVGPLFCVSFVRLVDIAGRNPLLGSSFTGQRSRPQSAGASRLIS